MEERLRRAAAYVCALGYSPAYVSLHGSQNYGLSLEQEDYRSDYDYKCIVFPSLWSLTQEEKAASMTVEFEGGQIDIKDIRLFARLLENMNPAYLECLITPHALALEAEARIDEMRALLPDLFEQRGARFARVCSRLFEEKAKRLYKTSPAQAENIARFGYDVKQAHHMYRLLVTLRDFERTGGMQLIVPQGERALLLDLKLGRIPLEAVQRMMDGWRIDMQALEERIARRCGKEKGQAARRIRKLAGLAVYEHCRKEATEDDGQSEA